MEGPAEGAEAMKLMRQGETWERYTRRLLASDPELAGLLRDYAATVGRAETDARHALHVLVGLDRLPYCYGRRLNEYYGSTAELTLLVTERLLRCGPWVVDGRPILDVDKDRRLAWAERDGFPYFRLRQGFEVCGRLYRAWTLKEARRMHAETVILPRLLGDGTWRD